MSYMKQLIQYITEAEQSKRMINPISWTDFLYAYQNNKKIAGPDTIKVGEYFSDKILNSDKFMTITALHPTYFSDSSIEQYYVICGNKKDNWSKFNIDDIVKALGKPNEEDGDGKLGYKDYWKVKYFENCIYCEIGTEQASNIHWILIADTNLYDDLGINITR